MAMRWAMLVAAALAILVVSGAMATPIQGSSLRLAVTAVFALLAPLFWPGRGATSARTVLRVVAWSIAVTVSAAIAILVVARPAQPWLPVVEVCAMLLMLLLLSHAAAAALESRWHVRSVDAAQARELAARAVAIALGLWGTLPFWAGPMAELVTTSHPGTIDAALGASPLAHLAVAANNDLLRNAWLYEHSNLAVLSVSSPEPATLAWYYGSACLTLALVVLASRYPGRVLVARPVDQ